MKKVLCKHCDATGLIPVKKDPGCYTDCSNCCGTGSIYYVSREQFDEIVAGRLSSRDLPLDEA